MSLETWTPEEYIEEFTTNQWFESMHFFENDLLESPELLEEIKERITPENLLGRGGIGNVFDLGNHFCIKIMPNRENSPNREMYRRGNPPRQEAEFLRKLSGFECQGVRTPKAIGYYIGQKGTAILMETMDAVNLQLALNGKEKFPENFDPYDFYDRLSSYIDHLHSDMGIAHGDLEPRNVMIDRETGLPIVIDFGNARYIDPSRPDQDPSAKADLKLLDDVIYEKLEKHFDL